MARLQRPDRRAVTKEKLMSVPILAPMMTRAITIMIPERKSLLL